MVTFDDILADCDFAFDEVGESATYRKANGTDRAITVVVNRDPVAPLKDINRGKSPVRGFSVPNHVTRGILITEWQPTDKLIIADDYGGSTFPFQLSDRPTASDGGRLEFKINE